MSDFILIISSFYIQLFSCEVFLYFLAGLAVVSVILLILRLARG